MATLNAGQRLRGVTSGLVCRVESLVGEGGQGEVFLAELNGRKVALKWYSDRMLRADRGLQPRLQVAIDRGAPSPQFLWPFELVTLPDGSGLGYLMRLRRPGFEKIHRLLRQEVQPSFRIAATLGCQLTGALFALHSKGLVYQDLNPGNVFFDPESGDVEICDNDNVDVDGAPSVILGVPEYQAPEVVLRRSGPRRTTDLHSLAVMLYRIFMVGHPLIGRRELEFANLGDEQAARRLFGSEARFVFDPADDSNRPIAGDHDAVLAHWAIYPRFLRDLFIRAFTEGLHDPGHGRVQETEWRRALSQLRDSVVECTHCHAENFYDPQRLARKEPSFECWRCGAPIGSSPPRIGIRRTGAQPRDAPLHVVVLQASARLFAHHTAGSEYDFSAPTAELIGQPLAMRNLSGQPWSAVDNAASTAVLPGDAVALTHGLRIRFGRTEGEIKL